MFPPIPPWNGMHPLVVHFPIALLMLVPLFLLVALAVRRHRIAFALSALMLMAIGTVSVWVA
ncbi:MAG: DUF2231 domain-containing protein, partial [Planctomycetota bacterium]